MKSSDAIGLGEFICWFIYLSQSYFSIYLPQGQTANPVLRNSLVWYPSFLTLDVLVCQSHMHTLHVDAYRNASIKAVCRNDDRQFMYDIFTQLF